MRASNLSQIVVHCGRVLIDWSLVLRACLVSGAGHAVAVITMALIAGGDGQDKTSKSSPLLIVSASEEVAQQLDCLTQSSTREFDRVIPPAADDADETMDRTAVDNTAITEWLAQNLTSPAPFASLTQGTGDLPAFTAEPQATTETDEKATAAARKLGRTASFYGVEAEGRRFVFVVDISGSMSGSRFRRARAELCESIEKLQPDQSFYVILFNTGAIPMPSIGMATADPANLQLLGDWLKTTQCQGETNPAPALVVALSMRPDAVYLLSDGKFDPGLAQTVSQLQAFQRIPVHTIGFGSRKGEPMLRAISEVSGGTYRYVR